LVYTIEYALEESLWIELLGIWFIQLLLLPLIISL
jgi:hypothetical protein